MNDTQFKNLYNEANSQMPPEFKAFASALLSESYDEDETSASAGLAIVTVDTGANLCWVFQAFKRSEQIIFTAGGNSPMGYSLPAAIASATARPKNSCCAVEMTTSLRHKTWR